MKTPAQITFSALIHQGFYRSQANDAEEHYHASAYMCCAIDNADDTLDPEYNNSLTPIWRQPEGGLMLKEAETEINVYMEVLRDIAKERGVRYDDIYATTAMLDVLLLAGGTNLYDAIDQIHVVADRPEGIFNFLTLGIYLDWENRPLTHEAVRQYLINKEVVKA